MGMTWKKYRRAVFELNLHSLHGLTVICVHPNLRWTCIWPIDVAFRVLHFGHCKSQFILLSCYTSFSSSLLIQIR